MQRPLVVSFETKTNVRFKNNSCRGKRSHVCLYVQWKEQKNGKKVPMETKELYLIGNNLASERSENRRLEGGSHSRMDVLDTVLGYSFINGALFIYRTFPVYPVQQVQNGSFWDTRDSRSYTAACMRTYMHAHTLAQKVPKECPSFLCIERTLAFGSQKQSVVNVGAASDQAVFCRPTTVS